MYIPEYPIANSCSGFSPFPVPPSAFGEARLSLRPFDSTWPLRPAPVAVPVTVYCNCVKTLHCVKAFSCTHFDVLQSHDGTCRHAVERGPWDRQGS
jgi:hypothetical protein